MLLVTAVIIGLIALVATNFSLSNRGRWSTPEIQSSRTATTAPAH